MLAVKLYRLTLDPVPAIPTLPCLDHEAMLHEGVAPHLAVYIQDGSSGDIHEVVVVPSEHRIEEQDFDDVCFVPLIGSQGWESEERKQQFLDQAAEAATREKRT